MLFRSSPGIETSDGSTLSSATSGDRSALRNQGKVGTPDLGPMDLDGNGSGSKVDDPSFKGARSTALGTRLRSQG